MAFWSLRRQVATGVALSILLYRAAVFITEMDYNLQNQKDALSTLTKKEYSKGKTESFDFIIIGAGSAGGVVANRLSKHFSVLLLETGGFPSPMNIVPHLSGAFWNTPMDYNYKTVPQKYQTIQNPDGRFPVHRGRGVGGGGNLYNMMYVRGNPKDYDRWAELTGNSIWSFKSVLGFFKKIEDYHGPPTNNFYHGTGGEIYTTESTYKPPIKQDFLSAFKEKNIPVGDINAVFGTVFTPPPVTIKKGERVSTYTAFIKPILKRKNLHLYRFSKALKIHFSEDMRAIGVTYLRHGVQHYAESRKEIIVSAGTIDSPRVLMYSGIGPKGQLKQFGIECLVDLPGVGQHLQDHVASLNKFLLNDSVSYVVARDFSISTIAEYVTERKGILSEVVGYRPFVGFTSSSLNSDKSWPDLYFIVVNEGVSCGDPNSYEPDEGLCTGANPNAYFDSFTVETLLAKPASLGGSVGISGPDMNSEPLIDPKYLTDETDIERLVDGILFLVDLFETSNAFKKYNTKVNPVLTKGCESLPFKSREYWTCFVQRNFGAGYHPTGTCKMGKDSGGDPFAVLDSNLRVRNTKGLRVVDASVMPHIITGNPNHPTVMIGEVASYLILKQWMPSSRLGENSVLENLTLISEIPDVITDLDLAEI